MSWACKQCFFCHPAAVIWRHGMPSTAHDRQKKNSNRAGRTVSPFWRGFLMPPSSDSLWHFCMPRYIQLSDQLGRILLNFRVIHNFFANIYVESTLSRHFANILIQFSCYPATEGHNRVQNQIQPRFSDNMEGQSTLTSFGITWKSNQNLGKLFRITRKIQSIIATVWDNVEV